MSLHRFGGKLQLPIALDQAWDFFSDPYNLGEITPPEMGFRVVNEVPHETYAGQIIVHKVSPLFSVPVTWVTEITHYHEKRMFVDEQRFGPYRFWHHQHHFAETDVGVLMTDIVHYDVGFGPIGDLMNELVVRNKIGQIFSYRTSVLQDRFGTIPSA